MLVRGSRGLGPPVALSGSQVRPRTDTIRDRIFTIDE